MMQPASTTTLEREQSAATAAERLLAALATPATLAVSDVAIDSLLASIIFIGLSVLTVPHMAMMALARAADRVELAANFR